MTDPIEDFAQAMKRGDEARWKAAEIAFHAGVGDWDKGVTKQLALAVDPPLSVDTVENLARAYRLYSVLKIHYLKAEDDEALLRLHDVKKRLTYVHFNAVAKWYNNKNDPDGALGWLESVEHTKDWLATVADASLPDNVELYIIKLPRIVKAVRAFRNVYGIPDILRAACDDFLVALDNVDGKTT